MVDKEFISSIRKAIKANDIETVEKLIGDNKEILNTVFVFGSWLHEAAGLGYIELAGRLLDMGINTELNQPSCKGSAIASAATKGQIEMIKFLLSRGMKLDVSDIDGNPLFCAIVRGNIDTVKFLIEAGINVNVNYAEYGDEPWTALELAKQCGNEEIVNLIEDVLQKTNNVSERKKQDVNSIEEYIENEIGKIESTIEGIPLIDNMKMNVHIIRPFNAKYTVLMTDGMSELALIDNSYTELLVRITNSWAEELVENQSDSNKEVHWIFKWLIYLSYIPHKHNCYLFNYLAFPTSKPARPIFKGTEMTSFMYILPKEKNWHNINIETKKINVFEIMPLYEDEYQLALEKRGKYSMKLLNDNNISTIIDWKRKNLYKC
ncbi:ankyrin repeat domain-containing protein [Clostridium gasigenes]|uniref:ankyrin repeat domain-containing protein n=1 Tax=Clostridium gasigenes TaxID=94869 RepID=UPI001C0ACBF7|nr:ankyrin repeat domain-containing protein [Clostridium gasigenes]MBU3107981.1 ankyrin repeat domain-containing protein [Clostridium gasigenes]